MTTPEFGSTRCTYCKGSGLDPNVERDCPFCKQGWVPPGRATPPPVIPDVTLGERQQRVFDVLADGKWHDGPELTHPGVGGSEGLRRLRELREKGYPIEMRLKAKGKTTRQYRLVGR